MTPTAPSAAPRERAYLFLELTGSLCHVCHRKIDAKVVEQEGAVYFLKWCPEHGHQKVLVSSDAAYYHQCRASLKPGQLPLRFHTATERGCPWDCGLCPDHEQHSCLALVEVTDRCNLTCPVCYSDSSPGRGAHRSLDEVTAMLDAVVASEGEPDVVQISGGEPTLHPDILEILARAKARPIKHLMLNTNGVRIAQDADFAARLAELMPGFEVYLQYDSAREEALTRLRGLDLRDVRRRALDRCNELGISTTLVVTVMRGVNDGELGAIVEAALQEPCVRGVTFQPVQVAGRHEGFDPARDRLTLGEVRRLLLAQSSTFSSEDVVPVPCHPDAIAMAYAMKLESRVVPLTRFIEPRVLLEGPSSIVYERDARLREELLRLFSTAASPVSSATSLRQLLCCLPQVALPEAMDYRNVFRVILMQFMDAWSFDVRSVKRTCVHIVHPDLRLIPFDTYNLFYRPGIELAPGAAAALAAAARPAPRMLEPEGATTR